MNKPLSDRLGGLLQTTVLQICQKVVPFSKDVTVIGSLSIQADSNEICKVKFQERMGKGFQSAVPQQKQVRDRETEELFRRSIEAINSLNDSDNMSPASRSAQGLMELGAQKADIGLKTPSPRAGELATMKGLTGSRQSLVDTLVAEALKVWYNEGPSPERTRVQEIRAEFAQDAQKSIAVELGIEAMNKYGQISPETLEAAAQLRRLGEQPQLLGNNQPQVQQQQHQQQQQNQQQPPQQQQQQQQEPHTPTTQNGTRSKHSRKQKLIANVDFETPKKGQAPEDYQTPLKNSKGMYECDKCGKEFTFGTNLTRHQRNFHGRPFTRKGKDGKKTRLGSKLSHLQQVDSSSCQSGMEDDDMEHAENNANLANQNKNMVPKHFDENRNVHHNRSVKESAVGGSRAVRTCSVTSESSGDVDEEDSVGTEDGYNSDSTTSNSAADGIVGTYASGKKFVYMSITDADSEPSYACAICNRKFPLYRNLGRHLKVKHSVSLIDIEMDSQRSNGQLTALKSDQVKGQDQEAHVCKLCGHAFSFASNLYRHISKVHKSNKGAKLAEHDTGDQKHTQDSQHSRNTATTEESSVTASTKLPCDLCDLHFTKPSNLARHRRKVHKMVRVPLPQKSGLEDKQSGDASAVAEHRAVEKTKAVDKAGSRDGCRQSPSRADLIPPVVPSQPVSTLPPQPALLQPASQMFSPQPHNLPQTPQLTMSPQLLPPTFPTFLSPHPHPSPTTALSQVSLPQSPSTAFSLASSSSMMLPHAQYSPQIPLMTPDPFSRGLGFPPPPPPSTHPNMHLSTPGQYPQQDMLSPVSSDVSPATTTSTHSSTDTSPQQTHISPVSDHTGISPEGGPPAQQQQQIIPLARQQLNSSVQQQPHSQATSQQQQHLTHTPMALPQQQDQAVPPAAQSQHFTAISQPPCPPNPAHTISPPDSDHSSSSSSSTAKTSVETPQTDGGKKPVVCPMCSMRFSFRTNLVRHLKNVHKCRSPNTDPMTEKSITPSKQRPLKPSLSTTAVPLKIPVPPAISLVTTPKSKISKSGASRSKKSNNTKSSPTSPRHRHTCPVCSWSFTFRTNLTRHMRKQHNQVPNFEAENNDPAEA